MIYLKRCDYWDKVFARYRDSFACTLDTEDFMSEKTVDDYCRFLNKELIRDLKRAKKEANRMVRQQLKAERKARRKARLEGNSPEAQPAEKSLAAICQDISIQEDPKNEQSAD